MEDRLAQAAELLALADELGDAEVAYQERQVEFFGTRDGFTVRCDPAFVMHAVGQPGGLASVVSCSDGEGGTIRIEQTFVGIEPVKVGGAQVPAVHVRLDSTFQGRATGKAFDELWLAADTGLTLRWDRTVDTIADAGFGADVRYQEDASFILESLQPTT